MATWWVENGSAKYKYMEIYHNICFPNNIHMKYMYSIFHIHVLFSYKSENNTCSDILIHTHTHTHNTIFYHNTSIYYEVIENPLQYISKYIVIFFNILYEERQFLMYYLVYCNILTQYIILYIFNIH